MPVTVSFFAERIQISALLAYNLSEGCRLKFFSPPSAAAKANHGRSRQGVLQRCKTAMRNLQKSAWPQTVQSDQAFW